MKRITFFLAIAAAVALFPGNSRADQVTGLTTFTAGTPAIADSVNANFSEIQDSVNDNDTRITALESVRRSFWIPVSENNAFTMPDSASTDYMWRFAAPSDYVPAGTGDVEIMAVFSGGDNCAFRYQFSTSGKPFGVSSNILISPATLTANIPDITAIQTYYSNLTITRTGFSDLSSVTFTRVGGDGGDTCTTNLLLYGVRVEYPSGP